MIKTTDQVQTGTISGVEDCGTIVIVRLRTPQGWNTPVFFDHRQFRGMLEAEGGELEDLIGRIAKYDGKTFRFED
jgi:hypothetical protein